MLVRPLWSQLLVAELTKHSKHKLSHIESVSEPLKSCSQPICCTIGQWWFIGCCPALLVVAGSCWAKWKLMKQMQQLPTLGWTDQRLILTDLVGIDTRADVLYLLVVHTLQGCRMQDLWPVCKCMHVSQFVFAQLRVILFVCMCLYAYVCQHIGSVL